MPNYYYNSNSFLLVYINTISSSSKGSKDSNFINLLYLDILYSTNLVYILYLSPSSSLLERRNPTFINYNTYNYKDIYNLLLLDIFLSNLSFLSLLLEVREPIFTSANNYSNSTSFTYLS